MSGGSCRKENEAVEEVVVEVAAEKVAESVVYAEERGEGKEGQNTNTPWARQSDSENAEQPEKQRSERV